MNFLIIASRLGAKRFELAKRLNRVNGDLQRKSSALSQDFEEQAVETANDEVLERIREATEMEIRKIDHALVRLSRGTYGLCILCDREIEAVRLQALPEADLCLQCIAPASATT
jgi:RNA polymerase-binding transcription factor DksA